MISKRTSDVAAALYPFGARRPGLPGRSRNVLVGQLRRDARNVAADESDAPRSAASQPRQPACSINSALAPSDWRRWNSGTRPRGLTLVALGRDLSHSIRDGRDIARQSLQDGVEEITRQPAVTIVIPHAIGGKVVNDAVRVHGAGGRPQYRPSRFHKLPRSSEARRR